MDLKFGLILSREARRPRHPRDQGLIEDLAGPIPKGAENEATRRRQITRDRFDDESTFLTTDPDDANGRPAVAGRRSKNGII